MDDGVAAVGNQVRDESPGRNVAAMRGTDEAHCQEQGPATEKELGENDDQRALETMAMAHALNMLSVRDRPLMLQEVDLDGRLFDETVLNETGGRAAGRGGLVPIVTAHPNDHMDHMIRKCVGSSDEEEKENDSRAKHA